MMLVCDGAMGLASAVVATSVGVAAGIVDCSEQATKTIKVAASAQTGSLVICVLLSFQPGVEARLQVRHERD